MRCSKLDVRRMPQKAKVDRRLFGVLENCPESSPVLVCTQAFETLNSFYVHFCASQHSYSQCIFRILIQRWCLRVQEDVNFLASKPKNGKEVLQMIRCAEPQDSSCSPSSLVAFAKQTVVTSVNALLELSPVEKGVK